MRGRVLFVGVATLVAFLVSPLSAAVATTDRAVSVTGAVATPETYTMTQLVALPQATYPVTAHGGPRTVTGVDLESLVARSLLVLPPGKNTQLRATITVTGRGHEATTFALGELDPSFGDHPAVLTVWDGDASLVVPGDRSRARSVSDVTGIQVDVSLAGAQSVPAGAVLVVTAHRTVTLSAALLARLPRRTLTVTFLAGTASQTHTETGPPLGLVLLAAGVPPTGNTAVVAVGDDGYGAGATLAEDHVGGRPLLLSTVEDGVALSQPRLVTDGDVKGGRYVSGVVVLSVNREAE